MRVKNTLLLILSVLFICSPIFCRPTHLIISGIKPNSIEETEKSQLQPTISDDLDFHNNSNLSYSSVENGSKTVLSRGNKNYALLVSVLVISFAIILINARVFYMVTAENPWKSRSINIFVAHLSSIAIGFTFLLLIYALEKSNVLSVTAPGLCELLSFLRTGLLCVFPLNAAAIIFVRVTKSTNLSGKRFVIRSICLVWTIALMGSFPSIFMVKYSKDEVTQQESCKQVPILGSYKLTLGYEVFRFFTFHFLECFYMAFALFQIRSKIRYLYILKPIPNDRMKKKVQRVRYIYVHSLIFILIWFPTGVGIGIYKVLCRKGVVDPQVKNYIIPLIFLSTSLYILSPLIYLLLHEDMSEVNFWEFSLCSRNGSQIGGNDYNNKGQENNGNEIYRLCTKGLNEQENNRQNQKEGNKRNRLHEITDMSRISTVGISTPTIVLSSVTSVETDQEHNSSRIELPAVQRKLNTEVETNDSVAKTKEAAIGNEVNSESLGKETSV